MTPALPTPARPLRPTEWELVRLCGEGMTYREIAERLRRSRIGVRDAVHEIARLLPGDREPYIRVCMFGVRLLVEEERRARDESHLLGKGARLDRAA